ncbi:hypothetical protein J3R30DRAFT_3427671 [Lentinula aciculospora]|uniref:Uncharacterized protein n=1 Tax=Lentinula aciculospora TaxID=153920 RepID=A0A9W9AUU1_9AGAR|nr:hypothetical protein J3R30DRAFT_3427671 [Lentinula aciculospora]
MIRPAHYYHLASLFLSIITLVVRDSALALPIGNQTISLSGREAVGPAPDELIAGYRYVIKAKAEEYNKAKTLTVIPATTKSIGEGAYLSPRLGEFPGKLDDTYWECIIIANKAKMLDALTPKLFVDDNAAISAQPMKLFLYAHKKGFQIGKTILFSRHFVFKNTLQMLIPPEFLVNSPSNPSKPAGQNSLGLRIHCTPLGM